MAKKPSRPELESRIASLKEELSAKAIQHKQELASRDASFATDKAKMETELDTAEEKISELKDAVEEKQEQLNDRELKKLAQAYRDQEKEYGDDVNMWLKYALWSFVAVAVSLGISLWLGDGKPWYDRLEYHVINFLTITALVFSLRQFSHFNKLRIDFANRKALAQAYHNIFTSTDDAAIKDRFLSEVVQVLCARSDHKPEANTIPEKLLESLTEITKDLSKVRTG